MSEMLPVTEKMLKQYGEFYPHGSYMKSGGEIVHVGAKELCRKTGNRRKYGQFMECWDVNRH